MRTCAAWRVRSLARRVSQFYDARLASHGLTISQFGLMAFVAGAEDDRLSALAERAGIDPSTLTRNLQALEREGWVEIANVGGDQRRRSAWLTEAGLAKLASAQGAWEQAQAEIEKRLPVEALGDLWRAGEALE